MNEIIVKAEHFYKAEKIWLENNPEKVEKLKIEEPDWYDLLKPYDDLEKIDIDKLAYKFASEEKMKNDKEYKELKEKEEMLEAWNNLETDNFHLNLIKYKETKSNADFEKIYNELRKMNRILAAKYILKLPLKAKQMYFAEANSHDYSEFLTELMLKAINAWKVEYKIKFSTFYDAIVRNFAGNIKNKMKCKAYQNTELISINTVGTEKMMNEIAKNHYKYDENSKMFMNTYVKLFVKRLNKMDTCLGLLFKALIDNNCTHAEIAKYMSVSTKTVQRKIQIIKKEWIEYNAAE